MSATRSSVSDQFPVGLRVLLVDDDLTCLTILDRMLKSCLYQVTKCSRAEVALGLLRENENAYDIVISDVHMPAMDGFKLLEQIVHEMDIPVIMMSADSSKNLVMKGVKYGACDFLVKPVRIEELKNIWQHVIRSKKHEQRRNVEGGDQQMQSRKPIVWTVELHQQFVAAVDQIGIDKAVPKKILELMNVPSLTREEVATHLQKYRFHIFIQGTPCGATSPNHPYLPSFSDQLLPSLDTAVVSTSSPDLPHLPADSIEISQTTESTTWMSKSDLRNLFRFEGIGKQKGGCLPVWIAAVTDRQPRTVAFNFSNFFKALAIIFSILFLVFHFFVSSM